MNYLINFLDLLLMLIYTKEDSDLIKSDLSLIEDNSDKIGIPIKIMKLDYYEDENIIKLYADIYQEKQIYFILKLQEKISSWLKCKEIRIVEDSSSKFKLIQIPLDRYTIGSKKYIGNKKSKYSIKATLFAPITILIYIIIIIIDLIKYEAKKIFK